jgi:hypothetical protein
MHFISAFEIIKYGNSKIELIEEYEEIEKSELL